MFVNRGILQSSCVGITNCTENAIRPTPTKSKNSNSSVQIPFCAFFFFDFVPRETEKICVLQFGGLRDLSICLVHFQWNLSDVLQHIISKNLVVCPHPYTILRRSYIGVILHGYLYNVRICVFFSCAFFHVYVYVCLCVCACTHARACVCVV